MSDVLAVSRSISDNATAAIRGCEGGSVIMQSDMAVIKWPPGTHCTVLERRMWGSIVEAKYKLPSGIILHFDEGDLVVEGETPE